MTKPNGKTVGIVGLGSMGLGTALALVDAGFDVRGYDVDETARGRLAAGGGTACASASEAAMDVPLLILMVVNAAQCEDVLFGGGGAADALAPNAVVMLCVTVPASFTESLAERLAGRGIQLLDAPVSGGPAKARQGALSIMAAGAPSTFERAALALGAMAETVHRLGDAPGMGSKVKTINQLLAGVHIAAACEAMALGIRMGADPEALYKVISQSAGASWMFNNRVPHILAGDYQPLSAVNIFVKDLGIVLGSGRDANFPLPLTATAHQMFQMAAAAGYGRDDDASVIRVFRDLTGIDLPGLGDTEPEA